ncbi:MAG TPA: hypothetical protein VER76_07795, partial [Pyrinomonadaceae bacterium]|nr:hypothetical protein [Pyrinomonadaceae bacterium]
VAAGFYNEAFDELARSFTLKDGQLETQLAGRTPARAATFIELLAPERRASIFQANAADTEQNARVIKGLLALHLALDAVAATAGEGSAGATTTRDASSVVAAANDFTSGTDEMRAFRQLYAAGRLLRRGVATQTVLELMDAARLSVDAAIDAPAATAATTADELRDVRASAIAQGGVPDIPTLPRNAISNILRGRIEEFTGMALLEQGKTTEAVAALKRAVSVLPERSLYWRTAQWRLGAALASGGQERDALAAYLKSYNPQSPDPARRAVIEALYTKVNGSTKGLEAQVGSAPMTTAPARSAALETTSNAAPTATPTETPAVSAATPEPSPASTPGAPVVTPSPSPEPGASPTPDQPVVNPSPETPATTPTPGTEPSPTPTPTQSSANADAPAPVGAKRPTREGRDSACTLVLGANALELNHSGGSASVIVGLEGSSNLAGISAATNHWSDIIVLREPQGGSDTNSLKFTITSISKATGNFRITFKSPCGAQELIATVK